MAASATAAATAAIAAASAAAALAALVGDAAAAALLHSATCSAAAAAALLQRAQRPRRRRRRRRAPSSAASTMSSPTGSSLGAETVAADAYSEPQSFEMVKLKYESKRAQHGFHQREHQAADARLALQSALRTAPAAAAQACGFGSPVAARDTLCL